MTWVFLLLALGAIAFTAHIMIIYKREADVLENHMRLVQAEKDGLEAKLRECDAEKEEAKDRIDTLKQTLNEYQSTIGELRSSITYRKGEMERRGRFRV